MKTILMAILFTLSGIGYAHAETGKEKHHEHKEPTKEERQEMAAAHEKMAVCLKSDRPIDECFKEMMDAHKGRAHCPMMGDHCKMDHGGGMHQGKSGKKGHKKHEEESGADDKGEK